MSVLSQIKTPDGNVYDIKDATMRSAIDMLQFPQTFNDASSSFTSWTLGGISESGQNSTTANRVRSIFLPILPDRLFKLFIDPTVEIKVFYYSINAQNSFIAADDIWTNSQRVFFNPPDGTRYYVRLLCRYVDTTKTVSNANDIGSLIKLIRLNRISS